MTIIDGIGLWGVPGGVRRFKVSGPARGGLIQEIDLILQASEIQGETQ